MTAQIEVLDYHNTSVELYDPEDALVIEQFDVQEVSAVEVWIPGPYSFTFMLENMS